MTTAEIINIAKRIAAQKGLDPALVCSLIEHESSLNPWAIRYEPAFMTRYVAPMNLSPSEATARSTSWGLGQVMGQTARELGFAGIYLSALCDPEQGIEFACRKLSNCLRRSGNDVNEALLAYNGGGDPNYPNRVLQYMPKYEETK